MPNIPQPFKMKDWDATARAYDRLAFDIEAEGPFLPLIWWDDTHINVDRRTFGLPSYVGSPEHGSGAKHEAINCLAALLGGTLAGIDKSANKHNWILAAEGYFVSSNGQNLILNSYKAKAGASFWYELYPHYLFYGLVDRYPNVGNLEAIMKTTAGRWYDACVALGSMGQGGFDHTSFNFETMQPVDNGKWTEPGSAGAIGWVEYMAYTKFGDPRYLEAADGCIRFLHERDSNPHYEALLPMGAYLAARMNAELGREYDVHKLLNWCFDPSDARPGWGVISERWGDYDCHGLVGSITDGGGYAFTMNAFQHAAVLVPLARYDDRYARAIGKWMLNVANAARLSYPGELPSDQQSCPDWKGDPDRAIAYEGLRKEGLEYARRTPRLKDRRTNGQLPVEIESQWKHRRPFACGDPLQYGWGPQTDFGMYGSSCVGFYAGIIDPTNEEKILQLDLLATDFFHRAAYPTFLYYNPHGVEKQIEIDVGPKPSDLYDATTGRFLRRSATGGTAFRIPADSAVVVVVAPAGEPLTRDGYKTLIGDVAVDYVGKWN